MKAFATHLFHGLYKMQKNICIVGSGTSGLVAAIILKDHLPYHNITVVSSEKIGIIGVGEGSTEHWRIFFQDKHNISVDEMVERCAATHKYGIRFEGWTTHTPDYFHSVSGGEIGPHYFAGNYAFAIENNMLLTNAMISHLYDNKIPLNKQSPHHAVNQFHFDTFKLNVFLKDVAQSKNVRFIDGEVQDITRNAESGNIESVILQNKTQISADFFIDSSGFHRALMGKLVDDESDFYSYRKYLPCDSAAVFQTESDESGEIKPYTRARAMPNGWMWEIPTQERRGNGYVFASDFCSDEQAVKELSEAHGRDIEPARIIKFKSGYYKTAMAYNCAAVGLSSSFIEPLEATSIATSIQQARMLVSVIGAYIPGSKAIASQHNKQTELLMENLVTMVAMHYISDRSDTEMWREQQNAEKPELLNKLVELWKERCPQIYDTPIFGYEVFHSAHFWHVAQGQGLVSHEVATRELNSYDSREKAARIFAELKTNALKETLVDHASIFKKR